LIQFGEKTCFNLVLSYLKTGFLEKTYSENLPNLIQFGEKTCFNLVLPVSIWFFLTLKPVFWKKLIREISETGFFPSLTMSPFQQKNGHYGN